MKKIVGKGLFAAGVLLLLLTATVQATLIDNGDGTVTDDSTGLMWLKNANLAATEIFGMSYDTDLGDHPDDPWGPDYVEVIRPDGSMTWGGALHWIDAMNAANYLGYNDWRLPIMNDIDVDTSTSELSYMFHDILGNESWYNPDGTRNLTGCPDVDPWCVQSTSADGVTIDNLQTYAYWTGTEDANDPVPNVWEFYTAYGEHLVLNKENELYSWSVRSGDIAAIPEPSTMLLVGLGLAGLGMARSGAGRRRRSFSSIGLAGPFTIIKGVRK